MPADPETETPTVPTTIPDGKNEADGLYYQDGKVLTGIAKADGNMYKDGLPYTGTINDVYYVNGEKFNGTKDDVLYENGQPVDGDRKGVLYEKVSRSTATERVFCTKTVRRLPVFVTASTT